jgi:hypothetical protein
VTKIITLSEITDPTAVANQAILYSKDVAGVTHFFARLSDGTIVQLSGASGGGGDLVPVMMSGPKTSSSITTQSLPATRSAQADTFFV